MRRSLFAIVVMAMVALALTASAAPGAGVLSADPDRVRFGQVVVGATVSADVVIYNNGTDALTLAQVGWRGDFGTDFSNSTCYWNGLPAGGSCQLRVSFSPLTRGGQWSPMYVDFRTAASTYVSIELRVQGTGTTKTAGG